MYEIVEKENLADNVKLFEIYAPLVAKKAKPGNFIVLRVDECGERIPLTITDFDAKKGTVTIVVQEVGKTTKKLGLLTEGDALLDFGSGSDFIDGDGIDEGNRIYLASGDTVTIYMTWNDWTASNQDYDLYLYDSFGGIVAYSDNYQGGTQQPTEKIEYSITLSGNYEIVIVNYDASATPDIEFFAYADSGASLSQQYHHPESTIITPANSGTDTTTEHDSYMQTTPLDIGLLLEMIYQCSHGGGALMAAYPGAFTVEECNQMIEWMSMNHVDSFTETGVPAGTRVAHKHGFTGDTHADAALVFSPGGDFVLVVFLYRPQWLEWEESAPLIANIATATYNYFNPTQ